jgi:hypothetical protein
MDKYLTKIRENEMKVLAVQSEAVEANAESTNYLSRVAIEK